MTPSRIAGEAETQRKILWITDEAESPVKYKQFIDGGGETMEFQPSGLAAAGGGVAVSSSGRR